MCDICGPDAGGRERLPVRWENGTKVRSRKGVLKRFPAAGSSGARSERKSNKAYKTVLRKSRVK